MRENALKAVADPTRRRILQLVRQEPSSVGDIARHFDTTQQAISQHLTLLRNAGRLEFRKVGTRDLDAVRTDGSEPIAAFWKSSAGTHEAAEGCRRGGKKGR